MTKDELLEHAIAFGLNTHPAEYRRITVEAYLIRETEAYDAPRQKVWRIQDGSFFWLDGFGFVCVSRSNFWERAEEFAFTDPEKALVVAKWIYQRTKDEMTYPWINDEEWFDKHTPPFRPDYKREP